MSDLIYGLTTHRGGGQPKREAFKIDARVFPDQNTCDCEHDQHD